MIRRAVSIILLAPAVLLAGCQGFLHYHSFEQAGTAAMAITKRRAA